MRRTDAAAFEELYRQHSARVFNLAVRMCGSRGDAEDLLQEIFLLAYRKFPDFRGDAAPGTWLYRLAINRCLGYRKSRQSSYAARTTSLELCPPPASARRAGGDGAVDRIALERAISALPEGAREVFLLHDVEGFGHAEIAEMLDISEGTSKSQVHKARRKLRELLGGTDAHL